MHVCMYVCMYVYMYVCLMYISYIIILDPDEDEDDDRATTVRMYVTSHLG